MKLPWTILYVAGWYIALCDRPGWHGFAGAVLTGIALEMTLGDLKK